MIFKDKNNKVLDAIKMDENKIQQMIDNCVELKSQSSPLKEDELSVRRNINMKKNKDGFDIFKKVAIAAVSVGLSGAVIAGVAKYNNELEKNEKGVAKETVEVTTDNDVINIETSNDLQEYYKVFPNSGTSTKSMKLGDYVFRIVENGVSVEYKNEKTKLPDQTYDHALFSNGEYVFYCVNQYLYKFNLRKKELEKKIEIFKCSGENNYKKDDRLRVVVGKKGYIYMNCNHKLEEDIYIYNIEKDEVKTIKDKTIKEDVDFGDYAICMEMSCQIVNDIEEHNVTRDMICKYTENGIEEVRTLTSDKGNLPGEDITFYPCNTPYSDEFDSYGWLLNGKIYIGMYEKYAMDIKKINDETPYEDIWDYSEVTIYTFDTKTEEYEKIGVLKASDFGFVDGKQTVKIKSIYNDYYLISIGNVYDDDTDGLDGEYDSYVHYKYFLNTKKYEIVHMSEW